MLKGKKSYLAGGAMVAYGALGFLLAEMDANQAMQMIMTGAAVMALRAGIVNG